MKYRLVQFLQAICALALILTLLVLVVVNRKSAEPISYPTVIDVSWPNCRDTVSNSQDYGIVGVNGGLDFRVNSCLAKETTWFSRYALYVNTGYPGIKYAREFPTYPRQCIYNDTNCLAYNYGYNATLYSINYANSRGAYSLSWWLDVETDNSWTENLKDNRASLSGAIDAIRQHVFLSKIGIYSALDQWKTITGGWDNQLPDWIGTGGQKIITAQEACTSRGFSDGSIWLTQYTPWLDQDYLCSQSFLDSLGWF